MTDGSSSSLPPRDAHPQPEAPVRIRPSAEDIAVETVSWLGIDNYASSVMKLDRPLLNEFGRLLITPGTKVSDACTWLYEQGVTIPRRNLYRFAQRFSEVAQVIQGEWEDRVVQSYLDGEVEAQGDELDELIRNRYRRLMAQVAVRMNVADIDPRELQLLSRTVEQIDGRAIDTAKLELAREKVEAQNAKLEAEVALLEQRLDGLPDKVAALQNRIDDLAQRSRRGEAIESSIFDRIRAELIALAPDAEGGREAA